MNKNKAREILGYYLEIMVPHREKTTGIKETELKEALQIAVDTIDKAYNEETYLPGRYEERPAIMNGGVEKNPILS